MYSIVLAVFISTSIPTQVNTTPIIVVNQYPQLTIVTIGDLDKVLVCKGPDGNETNVSLVVPQMFKDQVTVISTTCAQGKLWVKPNKE